MTKFVSLKMLFLAAGFTFMPVVAQDAFPEEDTSGPNLVNFSFTPTEIDTNFGPQTVTVTARVTDDLSGVGNDVSARFVSPTGQQGNGGHLYRTSGDMHDGVYTGTATFPQDSEQGTWKCDYLELSDNVDNLKAVDSSDLQDAGYNIFLEVDYDSAPVANAGNNQLVYNEVTLDGTKSYDPDGTIVSYAWVLVHIENPAYDRVAEGVNPVVSNLEHSFYYVTLTVTDNDGFSGRDTMLLGANHRCRPEPCQIEDGDGIDEGGIVDPSPPISGDETGTGGGGGSGGAGCFIVTAGNSLGWQLCPFCSSSHFRE